MRKSLLVVGLGLAFVLGFAGAFALQEEGKEQEGHEAPPPLQDEYLDRHVGTWEWSGTMDMGGGEMPFSATETIEWALNHQFLLSHYTSPMAPGQEPYRGLGLTRMTPGTMDYKVWWFDHHGVMLLYTGTRDGDTVVYTGESDHGKTRSTITMTKDGTAMHHYETQAPGSSEYKTFFKAEGKKKS